MKAKIISILLVVVGIGLIATGAILTSKEKVPKDNVPVALESYELKETNKLETCLDPACEHKQIDLYATMTYDYDSKVLQDALKKLNKSTEDYFNLAKNSDSSKEQGCEANQNKNSIRINNEYNSYSDGKIITLSIKRDKENLCTNQKESYQAETYIYDMSKDKILNMEETMQVLNLTTDDVQNAIKSSNESLSTILNKQIVTKESYDDIKIYYNTIGELYVSYFIDEINCYTTALIREKQA